jgi:hypothetical protein
MGLPRFLVGGVCFKCCERFFRKPYMKRLDKPTKQVAVEDLLNIKKSLLVPLKVLVIRKLTKCLASKTLIHCLTVYSQYNGEI